MTTRPQKLAAEFLGTYAIVLFSAGALCVAQLLPSEYSNTAMLGQVGLALAYGLPFAALSAALAPISGGHFNPALTIGFWVTSRQSTFDTLCYWVAQLAGAAAAAYTLRGVLPEGAWRAVSLGAPEVANGLSRGPTMVIEGLGTFFLMLVFFAFESDELVGRMAAAIAGGLVIIATSLFAAPLTGAAINPARAFGPALAASHWANIGVYCVGPLAGAMLAAWGYDALFLHKGILRSRRPQN